MNMRLFFVVVASVVLATAQASMDVAMAKKTEQPIITKEPSEEADASFANVVEENDEQAVNEESEQQDFSYDMSGRMRRTEVVKKKTNSENKVFGYDMAGRWREIPADQVVEENQEVASGDTK